MGNKWLEQEFKTLDVEMVIVTEAWVQLWEVDNGLMVRDYSIFRRDREDERIEGGTLPLKVRCAGEP